jgi:predicted phosphodiesterase
VFRVTGDKEKVLTLMRDTVSELEQPTQETVSKHRRRERSVAAPPPSPEERNRARRAWSDALEKMGSVHDKHGRQRAAGAAAPSEAEERAVATPFAPRDQHIALFQSAMDEYLEEIGVKPDADAAAKGRTRSRAGAADQVGGSSLDDFYNEKAPRSAERAFDALVKYGKLDPQWVEVVVEKAQVLAHGKHPFVSHASANDFRFAMDERTTVAIVGDWGGGNAAAQAVAAQIANLKPTHVIHLGDVYYAGTPKEVEERFLRYWPAPQAPGRSFALNSNHEMYSGGFGYFDLTLRKFGQPASYFNLSNKYWRFIGLDTGYDEHDLHAPQADWLAQQLGDGPKNVLLSHHQLFSAYEATDASRLEAKVAPMLSRIYGWIWGHEHLAVVYEKHRGINAICLGNGCFPYDLPRAQPAVPVKWIDNRKSDDVFYPGQHTFALLKLDGPTIDLDFIAESGDVVHREQWS